MSGTGRPPLLDVEAWTDGGRLVVEMAGELDVYSAPRLRDVLDQQPSEVRRRVAMELSRLNFLDSSGLGVLIGAMKRAQALGGGLCLVGTQERVLKTFRITGLVHVMPPFRALEEAFAWLDTQRGRGR
jgi:anti-sigma B factor antagonist